MSKKTRFILAITVLVIGVGALAVFIVLKLNINNGIDQDIELMAEGNRQANKKAEDQLKKYPILEWIPYIVDEYSKDMTTYTHYEILPVFEGDDMTVVIKDYTSGNEQSAKEKIESWGIKLSDYKIRYENLSSEYGSVRVPDD